MTKTIEQLKATVLELFAKLEAKPEAKPVLEVGVGYYYVTSQSEVYIDNWLANSFDTLRLSAGNVFLTQADAEDELIYRKLCYRLLKYTRGVDWGNSEQDKFGLNFHVENNTFEIWNNQRTITCKLYFKTKEDREEAMKKLTPEQWKFYFGYQSKAVVL